MAGFLGYNPKIIYDSFAGDADQVAEYERLMHENLIHIHKNAAGITTDGVPSGWPEQEVYISSATYNP